MFKDCDFLGGSNDKWKLRWGGQGLRENLRGWEREREVGLKRRKLREDYSEIEICRATWWLLEKVGIRGAWENAELGKLAVVLCKWERSVHKEREEKKKKRKKKKEANLIE